MEASTGKAAEAGGVVYAGVDTHRDEHALCLIDGVGRKVFSGSFAAGYDELAAAIGDSSR